MDLQALNTKDNHTLSRVTRPRSKVSAAPFFWGGFFGQLWQGIWMDLGRCVLRNSLCFVFGGEYAQVPVVSVLGGVTKSTKIG